MATKGQPVYNVYPLTNYTFGNKQPKLEKDTSVQERLARLRSSYEQHGMRRSVEAVLVVQEHNTPHVLLLQLGLNHFKLPGGRLRPGEEEVEGLRRKLTNTLAPANPSLHITWDVGEVLGVFYRPNFDTVFYPYVPPHITRPKESRTGTGGSSSSSRGNTGSRTDISRPSVGAIACVFVREGRQCVLKAWWNC